MTAYKDYADPFNQDEVDDSYSHEQQRSEGSNRNGNREEDDLDGWSMLRSGYR